MKLKTVLTVIALAIGAGFFTPLLINAQSATTDTLSKGQMYVEGAIWVIPQKPIDGGARLYAGRFSYGLGKGVEAGVNFAGCDPYSSEHPPELQPNVKWKFYANESRGIQAAGGVMLYIPLQRRSHGKLTKEYGYEYSEEEYHDEEYHSENYEHSDGPRTFGVVYANVSKDIKQMKDARVTFGGYQIVGRNKSSGSTRGFNIAYDQPITKKIMFSGQWVTGYNRFGYFTPGFLINTTKRSNLYLGYSIGNKGYDNHGPYVSYGMYF